MTADRERAVSDEVAELLETLSPHGAFPSGEPALRYFKQKCRDALSRLAAENARLEKALAEADAAVSHLLAAISERGSNYPTGEEARWMRDAKQRHAARKGSPT